MILVGSINATTADVAIFDSTNDGSPTLVTKTQYACQNYPQLANILEDFLGKHQLPEPLYAACLGINGPVKEGIGTILKWNISDEEVSKLLTKLAWKCPEAPRGLPVELINSAELVSVNDLDTHGQLIDLNPEAVPPTEDNPNRAWIAPTNGLGEALFYWDSFNNQFMPSPSEGGHANFAPRTQQEIALLSELFKKSAPVSYEQILSLKGLVNIYQFLSHKTEEISADKIIQDGMANPADKNNLCTQTLDLFVSILGAEAGNLALKYYALGGIYVGGGIAPKIVAKLQEGSFMAAFKDRENEKIAELVAKIPVKVVTNPDIMLFGAAQRALEKELMGKALYAQCQ